MSVKPTAKIKEIIEEINLLRSDPPLYAKKIEEYSHYFTNNIIKIPNINVKIQTQEGPAPYLETVEYLKGLGKVNELIPSKALCEIAQEFADNVKDSETGEIDEEIHEQIIDKHGTFNGRFTRAMDFGGFTSEQVVINFLVCDGDPDRSQREPVLGTGLKKIGIAFGPHDIYSTVCVLVTCTEFKNTKDPEDIMIFTDPEEEEKKRKEQERLEKERLEKERLEQERLEKERLEKERLEQERLEKERLEQERLEKERLERERLEQERLEKERLEKERLEQERLEQERLEKERLEREKREEQTLAEEKENAEKERLEKERLEKERLEKERLEKERLEKERLEKERLEKERLEKEKLEKEKLEKEKLEKEKLEKEKLEKEKLEKERIAKKKKEEEEEKKKNEKEKEKKKTDVVKKKYNVINTSKEGEPTTNIFKLKKKIYSYEAVPKEKLPEGVASMMKSDTIIIEGGKRYKKIVYNMVMLDGSKKTEEVKQCLD